MINRHQTFLWFQESFIGIPFRTIQMLFKGMTDEDIAKQYNLTILRKGLFHR